MLKPFLSFWWGCFHFWPGTPQWRTSGSVSCVHHPLCPSLHSKPACPHFFCFFSLPPSCLSGAHFPEINLVKIQQTGAAAFVWMGQGKAKLCHPVARAWQCSQLSWLWQWPPVWLYPAGTPISSTSAQWDSLQAAEFLSCTLWKASPACPWWSGYEWAQERWIILYSITYPLGPCSLPL